MSDEIFVADLGIYVKIRKGTIYERLLWKVIDTREYSKQRANLVLPPNASPRGHYYFSSPKAAAKIFQQEFNFEEEKVQAFYERRDSILEELRLGHDNWYDSPMFASKSLIPKRKALASHEFLNRMKQKRDGTFVIEYIEPNVEVA